MAQHHRAGSEDRLAKRIPPPDGAAANRDLGDDPVGHAVEQVVLALHMRVQRHRLDAKVLAELAHADGFDTVAVGEIDRGVQHPWAGERCAALGRYQPFVDLRYLSLPLDVLTVYGLPCVDYVLTA